MSFPNAPNACRSVYIWPSHHGDVMRCCAMGLFGSTRRFQISLMKEAAPSLIAAALLHLSLAKTTQG